MHVMMHSLEASPSRLSPSTISCSVLPPLAVGLLTDLSVKSFMHASANTCMHASASGLPSSHPCMQSISHPCISPMCNDSPVHLLRVQDLVAICRQFGIFFLGKCENCGEPEQINRPNIATRLATGKEETTTKLSFCISHQPLKTLNAKKV